MGSGNPAPRSRRCIIIINKGNLIADQTISHAAHVSPNVTCRLRLTFPSIHIPLVPFSTNCALFFSLSFVPFVQCISTLPSLPTLSSSYICIVTSLLRNQVRIYAALPPGMFNPMGKQELTTTTDFGFNWQLMRRHIRCHHNGMRK